MTVSKLSWRPLRYSLALGIGLLALAMLALQLTISTQASLETGEPFYQAFWNLVGYFTIWTNGLVAAFMLRTGWKKPDCKNQNFQAAAGFVTTQILIVGLIYHFMLRHLYHLQGLFQVADHGLHVVMPALVFAYWVAYAGKDRLSLLDPLKWLWFLVIYATYAFIRGGLTGKYAYPFIDLNQISILQAVITSAILAIVFYGIGAGLVLGSRIGHSMMKKIRSQA